MCVCAFVFVSVCDVYVHLSVKVTIGSGFNLHEKIMSECNQMGLCLRTAVYFIWWRTTGVYSLDRVNRILCAFVSVRVRLCHSVCYKLGFHSIKFDISPYQLCKSHNDVPLDLCCRWDNHVSLMYRLDDCKVELRRWTHTKLFQLTLNYHDMTHMGQNDTFQAKCRPPVSCVMNRIQNVPK